MPPPMVVAGLFLLVCLVGADSRPMWPIPSDLWKPPSDSTPEKGNFVYLNSQPGDSVGGGLNYSYTPLNTYLSLTQTAYFIRMYVQYDEDWTGVFEPMSSLARLERGYYGGVEQSNNASVGGLSWNKDGQGCDTLTGWFAVDEVTYKRGNLTFISLRFEQHCGGESPALRGALRWDIDDHQEPNGPVNPPPKGLWTPPNDVILSGDYLYLEDQHGNYSCNSTNAIISTKTENNYLAVSIYEYEGWYGEFRGMSSIKQLVTGYYGELQADPFQNPVLAGMSLGYECGIVSGWFVIDEIAYNSTGLVKVTLRFAQRCNGATYFGAFSWNANYPSSPPGPVNPPPNGLWTPPEAAISSGNYVYLESQQGDWVGGGQNYSYTSANAIISISAHQNQLSVSMLGNSEQSGQFQGVSLQPLAKGYYGAIQLYPFESSVLAGLLWGDFRCFSISGWFVVDEITYNATELVSVTLRFAQHCNEATPALYGALNWSVNNPVNAPGPVNPPPQGLWTPPESALSSGNYIYLESQEGDSVGGGQNYSYTSSNALISITTTTNQLSVSIDGNEQWSGEFRGMSSVQQLIEGYYGDIMLYPFSNPVLAGLRWGYCYGPMSGWFVIDEITYNTTGLVSVTLRFAQHYNEATPALYGALSWNANNPSNLSGPVNPPPQGLWTPPKAAISSGNYMYLESQAGDSVGEGQNYSYTSANASFSISVTANQLFVSIRGNEMWIGEFHGMCSIQQLAVGYYGELQSNPFNNLVLAGLSWKDYYDPSSEWFVSGWFVVDEITYNATGLVSVTLRFAQHYGGATPALYGALSWSANHPINNTPGPVNPPPNGLWTPPKAAISSGNYVYLESQQGDWVGGGQNYSYTSSNALIKISINANWLSVSINGNQQWSGTFQSMNSIQQWTKGYYGNLQISPFNNPVLAGLNWGNCYRSMSGWFVVDEITYNAAGLVSVQLRFAQHCEEAIPALYGALYWSANNPVYHPVPVNPPPQGLWKPAANVVPESGNYVYLESDPGDCAGEGQNYTYTSNDTDFTFTTSGNLLNVAVNGNEEWSGNFEGMRGLNQLEQGYYGGLQIYPGNNPIFGGLSWAGMRRSYYAESGWFAIDQISYFRNGTLRAIKLRFEQYCGTGSSALHGAIVWAASNPVNSPGPVNPPPEGLWTPPQDAISSGNYVYLESQEGDSVGGGQNYSYTSSNAIISISTTENQLSVSINGNERWSGEFRGMSSVQQLIKGYYGKIQVYPFDNPVLAGLTWGSINYNPLSGWFVVDEIAYNATGLVSVTLRFAQHCGSATPALYGALSWSANNPLNLPAPVNPPPEGLWTPASNSIPSGNYVYLESEPEDYIGAGQNYTYTSSNSFFYFNLTNNYFSIMIHDFHEYGYCWYGVFEGMMGLTQLEAGYYGELLRYPGNNPVLGGLDWYDDERNCNTLSGWFVVDAIAVVSGEISELELRFEQHCEGAIPALHGAISWKPSTSLF